VQLQRPFNPVVAFRNSQGEAARGTLTGVQRRSCVMEVYNPDSNLQVSEVLRDLNIRSNDRSFYQGKAIIVSLLNTGLMSVVSLALVDEWSELDLAHGDPDQVGLATERFIADWENRPHIRQSYQVVINELRSFLSETARWIEQSEMDDALPKEASGRLADNVFWAMANPLLEKLRSMLAKLELEAAAIPEEESLQHRAFAQTTLHPLILRAPFVYRTFVKPLGYAGDYEMVNQLLGDSRQGGSTYLELVNAIFLKSAVAQAHRNRINILVDYLKQTASAAASENRPYKVLNIGCGPAAEIQRLIQTEVPLHNIEFTLVDFSKETLSYTRKTINEMALAHHSGIKVDYVQESVHEIIKKKIQPASANVEPGEFDFIYCAGLFDYLSDKVCIRLIKYFISKGKKGTRLLLTNVHTSNPERYGMEHLLEWHLIYRNEADMQRIMSVVGAPVKLFTDETGVNVFAEAQLPGDTTGGEKQP
jgi:extracellular factor (EF) 3-hydroxypalmitic acid methyl ester biosynthesis protein